MTPTAHPLDAVLRPRSVAVIGASSDPSKRGHHAVRSLIESAYSGRIIPVHRAGGELLGLPVARGPADLATAPDLVLVCTPAATVPAVLEEWSSAGARGAVVLASGFAESGEAGRVLERQLRDIAARTGLRIAGPNTSGLINVRLGLNLIGLRGVRAGSIALLVQSGNLTLQLVTEAATRMQEGFSFCIGAGNETDIRFDEYLDFLVHDECTRAVLIHAEGFRDARCFINVARSACAAKPIVLLKGARTTAGSAAARSHTGALAGSYELLQAGLRQAGVQEVTRTDELLAVGQTLALQPAAEASRGLAILSDGGGHGALAVDTLQALGTSLAVLSDDTRARLRSLLGPAAALANPVDLAGAADRAPLLFARSLETLLADPGVGGVVVVGLFGGYAIRFAESLLVEERTAALEMAAAAQRAARPLVVHSLYAQSRSDPLRALVDAGVPVIESLEVACACVAALFGRGRALARLALTHAEPPTQGLPGHSVTSPVSLSRVESVLECVRAEQRTVLLEPEARTILHAHGAPLVPAVFCSTREHAALAAASVKQNLAVRVVSPAASHKTEAGGVALNVAGEEEAVQAFDRVIGATTDYAQKRGLAADIRGVLVSPMQPPPLAAIIVGATRDAQFGPALTIGAGGSHVEVLRDAAHVLLPARADEIRELIDRLRIAPLLQGFRGRPGADLDSLVAAAQAVAAALLGHEAIREIEINPLFVYADRCVALDARAYLTP